MNSGSSSLESLLKPVAPFFAIVNKIQERAASRGELGEGGGMVWDLAEWKRFCRAARENPHLTLVSTAVWKTVTNVELMIADGKTARQIHAALYWRSREDDSAQARRAEADRKEAERSEAAAFEAAVQEKMRDERARAEARRRVREEYDDKPTGRRVAV